MVLGIIKLVGAVLYLYLLWRNLRDNYKDELLVVYGWLSLLVFLIGSRVTFGLLNWGKFETFGQWFQISTFPGMFYGGGVVAVLLMTWWFSEVNSWKIWSFLEDALQLFFGLLTVIVLGEWWSAGMDIRYLMVSLTMLFGLTLAWFFKGRYRSFTWYVSGKKGFAVGMTAAIIFLLLALEAFLFKEGLIILILYVVASLISLTQLVILGEIWHKK